MSFRVKSCVGLAPDTSSKGRNIVLPILEAAKERAEDAVACPGSGLLKNIFLRASSRCCKADLSITSTL